MGFWYLLILLFGVFLIVTALIKRSIKLFKKLSVVGIGACMIAFSIFMFQDGSAEIVDSLLKSINIHL